MPSYVFHLHDGRGAARSETVVAEGVDEARDLAELRLLLGGPFVRIEVFENGEPRMTVDRGPAPAHASDAASGEHHDA